MSLKRNVKVAIRFTKAECSRVKKAAKHEDMSLTAWARKLLLAAERALFVERLERMEAAARKEKKKAAA